MALDRAGRAHVAYIRAISKPNWGEVIHAYRDQGQWIREVAATDFLFDYDSYREPVVSLTLDSGDLPHIAYIRPNSTFFGIVVYAWKEGTEWRTEWVSVEGATGSLSLAVDSQNRPHVAYVQMFHTLRYGYRVSPGQWWLTTVSEDPSVSIDTASLAVGSDNIPQLAFGRWSSGLRKYEKVLYARWTRTGWLITLVDMGGVGAGQCLTLDAQNRPHLLYDLRDPAGAYAVRHARLKDQAAPGAWVTTIIESSRERLLVDGGGAIRIDSEGGLHAAYSSQVAGSWSESEIKYAYSANGQTWAISTVQVLPEHRRMGVPTAVTVDSAGRPSLAYNDLGLAVFKYAQQEGATK
ncbi:MAG: hypothetical protein HYY13_11410 [Nitrospirae bacterium]|nr:hypothetical protein [Nitrospirota bacterium]